MHQITAIFEDGRSIQFPSRPDEIVYQAAYRANIPLVHDCLEGACASCKALCTQGKFTVDDYSDEALSDRERDAGYTLLCRMKAKTPCTIELPYASGLLSERHAAQWIDARVAELEDVAIGVRRMVLEIEDAGLDFLPGQYLHMEIPGGTAVRSYSFANIPLQPRLEFFLKVYARGAMSDYLRERARVGDALRIKGPAGHFYMRASRRPMLLIAGGTGLAPMLSMLRSLESMRAERKSIRLIYGVNHALEFFGTAELQRLAGVLPLEVERIAVSASDWSGPVGYVTALLRPDILGDGDCDIYMCGPPPMIESVSSWLQENSVDRARMHAERFVTSG